MILPETATAAVFFIGDQILHVSRGEKGETHKYISSEALREAVGKLPIDSGWIPGNVRRQGIDKGIPWFVSFHEAKERRAFIKRTRIRIPCPPIVFAGKGNNYYIYAVTEKVFSPRMILYRLPLPNVHRNGNICYGGNSVAVARAQNEPRMWRLFWDAPFTHDLAPIEELVELSKQGHAEYPMETLTERLGGLEQLVRELKGGGDEPDDPA